MNRNAKLFWMFAPLALFFAGMAFLVNDARNPAITQDQCKVAAVGPGVSRLQGQTIYRQSENALNDVGLQCQKLGILLLNDIQLFQARLKNGQNATVSRREYHLLPVRWMVSVHTGLNQK